MFRGPGALVATMTARILRLLTPLLALAAMAAPTASAQAPLVGKGENLQPIARVPINHPNEVELAGDWAFVSDDTVTGDNDDTGGLTIVNIKDPAHPFIEGHWECPGGWGDVDLSTDGNIAILTNAHQVECLDANTAVAIIDTSDKKHPKLLSSINYDDDFEYVHTSTLDNHLLYLNPQAAAFYPQGQNPHIPIFDITDPTKPVKKGFVESTGVGLAHDTFIDHRPDGKTLMYAASVHTTDVFDITDPFKATMLQRTTSPEITISHDVQPNHKRDVLVVDDEGAAGGQLDEQVSACGKLGGPGPAAIDSGSVHFYAAAADGTFANEGAVELGSWNAPANVNTGACVAHVFWQAPDQNRLTQAYYRTGAYILDFEDPANAKMLGSFLADGGSDYWSFKPHRGYIFGTDQDGGLDILRYTGEGGKAWPTTSGPAEIQRAARQGVPYKPLVLGDTQVSTAPLPAPPAATASDIGKIAFSAKLKKIKGKKGKKVALKIVFTDAKGKTVGTAKFKKAAGKKATVKVAGGAVAGTYRWAIKAGKKTLKKGKITVKKTAGWTISSGATLSAKAK
jgi:hypothetical protein